MSLWATGCGSVDVVPSGLDAIGSFGIEGSIAILEPADGSAVIAREHTNIEVAFAPGLAIRRVRMHITDPEGRVRRRPLRRSVTEPDLWTGYLKTRSLGIHTAVARVETLAGEIFDSAPIALFSEMPREGFGAYTIGGRYYEQIHIDENSEAAVRNVFQSVADRGQAQIIFDVTGPISITSPLPVLNGSNITIEGRGVELVATFAPTAICNVPDPRPAGCTAALIDVRGNDVIVRNMRLRNAGDNLRAQGANAFNILFTHISSTGAADDGISIGYGAHDVTLQYALLAGNTRSIFVKEGGTTNVSIHHSWIMKQWARGPMINGALADMRNVIVEDWASYGTRFEDGATGNIVSSLWRMNPYAVTAFDSGSPCYSGSGTNNENRSLTLNLSGHEAGAVYTAGNLYDSPYATPPVGSANSPFLTPRVTTLPIASMVPFVQGIAGVTPRDATDTAYINRQTGWCVSASQPFRNP